VDTDSQKYRGEVMKRHIKGHRGNLIFEYKNLPFEFKSTY